MPGKQMTSRERVRAALNHELPDRVPIQLEGITTPQAYMEGLALRYSKDLPALGSGEGVFLNAASLRALEELKKALGSDIAWVMPGYIGPEAPEGTTYWGTILQGPFAAGYSQSRSALPLYGASSVKEIEDFSWPSPDCFDYSGLHSAAENCGDQSRELGIGWEPFFDRVLDLFGMEEAMVMLHTQPELIEAAMAHIEEFVLGKAEKALNAAADVCDTFRWGDDIADARGVMIGPELWRRFFAGSLRKLCDLVDGYGLKFKLHCCGTFTDVMPDLIDMGIALWEPCQFHLPGNDPKTLKDLYGRHLTFCGGIDTQHTLPFRTAEEVRNEVRIRIDVLGKGGGYICGPDHDVRPEVPKNNLSALLDEIKTHRTPECVL